MHAITYIKSQLINKSKNQILIISNTNFWYSRRLGRTRTTNKNMFLCPPIMYQPGGIEKTCAHTCHIIYSIKSQIINKSKHQIMINSNTYFWYPRRLGQVLSCISQEKLRKLVHLHAITCLKSQLKYFKYQLLVLQESGTNQDNKNKYFTGLSNHVSARRN